MRFTVSPATQDDLTTACRLLASPRPTPDRDQAALRYRGLLAAGEFDPAGLLVARDEAGVVRGAMLAQPLAGALGLAWPPRAERGRDRLGIEDGLATAACSWLQSRGVKVCQSFAPEIDRDDFAPLLRQGFRRVTQLTHMRRELDPEPPSDSDDVPRLLFEQVTPGRLAAFADALLATYDGSLDCPEVAGTRTPDELLDGFRGPLTIHPAWWYLAREGNRPVGVVMFEVGTEPGLLELSYLGLTPAARGRGLGDELMRFALGVAAADRCRAMGLSVDVRNEPALRLYRRHAFRGLDRRDVYLAAWPAVSSPPSSSAS
jgi:ribosomal protein S18 acetylase RimI-like enzyme